MDEDTRKVEVGGETYTLGNFSTLKFLQAADLFNAIMDEVPGFTQELGDYVAEFRSKHTVRMTRAAAEMQLAPETLERISEEAWLAGGGELEMPGAPSGLDIAARFFPKAFKISKERTIKLVALVAMKERDLQTAYFESQDLDTKLEQLGNELLRADLGDLIDLLSAAAEVIQAQFEGKADKLRAVADLFRSASSPSKEGSTPEPEEASTPPSSSPSSPTDSPPPITGPGETSSPPPGQPSAASVGS